MYEDCFRESDWKLYRKKIDGWQEAYMAKLNREYIGILIRENDPSVNFWELDKRIREDKKKAGVVVEMKRSALIMNIVELLNDNAIGLDDLEDFSDELKQTVHFLWTGERNFE